MKNPPSIVVSIFPNSRTNWTPVRNQIVAILHEQEIRDVGVYIVSDEIIRGWGRTFLELEQIYVVSPLMLATSLLWPA